MRLYCLGIRMLSMLFLLGLTFSASAGVVIPDTLYINRGVYTAVDGTTFPALAFNGSDVFSLDAKRLISSPEDTLALAVINLDSVIHGFTVADLGVSALTLLPGDTADILLTSADEAVYLYYDHLTPPTNRYLGLSGMYVSEKPASTGFFWHLREHQKQYADSLAVHAPVNWNAYNPDYFTINGRSNPDINADVAARPVGQVGDTLLIYVANAGVSAHSLHFHGYHLTLRFSNRVPMHQGRSKDTYAVMPMECQILELVPDKPGEYPVHDHNLVAVSAGNIYPNGMFLTMLISP